MLAAYAGHAELTQDSYNGKQIETGSTFDLGQSMIAGAVFKSHNEVVRILAKAGADPRIDKPTAIEEAHIFGRKYWVHSRVASALICPLLQAPVPKSDCGQSRLKIPIDNLYYSFKSIEAGL